MRMGESVGELGEDALIASVQARLGRSPGRVLIGPGDDAAVLSWDGPLVASTDTLVEGFDFRRDWSSGHDVGVKTAAQNLADLAAMGASPVAMLVSLTTPPDLPAEWALALTDGLAEECERAGATVVGGDVSQGPEVVITATALGALIGPAVRRSGARAGDVVAVAGVLGPSAAGLDLLRHGYQPAAETEPAVPAAELQAVLRAHLAPRPDYAAGPRAAGAGATAMIDTSDGLLRDATRIATASAVVVDLDQAALDVEAAPLRPVARLLGDPEAALRWVLTGGEDHALLACFGPGSALPPGFRPIGRVRARDGHGEPPGVLVAGRPWIGPDGWHHFG